MHNFTTDQVISSDIELKEHEYSYRNMSITLSNITDSYIYRLANMDYETIVIKDSAFHHIHLFELSCIQFIIYNCHISYMPQLPFADVIYCPGNGITRLRDCDSCEVLYCPGNQLTQLPDLKHCSELDCSFNQINHIPDLPNCKKFIANNNLLTQLPQLPIAKKIYCHNNPITKWNIPLTCIRLKV